MPVMRLKLGLCLLASALLPASARNIFHFGDSYSTTLYNPAGTPPSSANPIGNPAFPGVTTSGGPNFIADLITAHPTSGGTPTFIYNYAYPGAVVNNTLENGNPAIPDFVAQFAEFSTQKHYLKGAQDVVSIYFGTNDIDAFETNPTAFPNILASLVNVMNELYAVGARRFVVFGMDPLQRVPAYQLGGALFALQAVALAGVTQWNLELNMAISGFHSQHADATALIFDTKPSFNKVLNNPQAYGAPNNTCYNPDGTSCLWTDVLHPGQAIHRQLATGFATQLTQLSFF